MEAFARGLVDDVGALVGSSVADGAVALVSGPGDVAVARLGDDLAEGVEAAADTRGLAAVREELGALLSYRQRSLGRDGVVGLQSGAVAAQRGAAAIAAFDLGRGAGGGEVL